MAVSLHFRLHSDSASEFGDKKNWNSEKFAVRLRQGSLNVGLWVTGIGFKKAPLALLERLQFVIVMATASCAQNLQAPSIRSTAHLELASCVQREGNKALWQAPPEAARRPPRVQHPAPAGGAPAKQILQGLICQLWAWGH